MLPRYSSSQHFYCAAFERQQDENCKCGTGGRCYSRPALLTGMSVWNASWFGGFWQYHWSHLCLKFLCGPLHTTFKSCLNSRLDTELFLLVAVRWPAMYHATSLVPRLKPADETTMAYNRVTTVGCTAELHTFIDFHCYIFRICWLWSNTISNHVHQNISILVSNPHPLSKEERRVWEFIVQRLWDLSSGLRIYESSILYLVDLTYLVH